MSKRFISKGESIINVVTDELVNASSEAGAEILVGWLNELSEENEQVKKELNAFKPVMFQDMREGTVILYRKGDVE